MKSSALFEHGPLPPYVHLASTKRHSRDRCSQAFPIFRSLEPRLSILDFVSQLCTRVGWWATPHYVHLASTRHHSRDKCSQAFPVFRATSVYYTEQKPKNKKRGRPGNEAISKPWRALFSLHLHWMIISCWPWWWMTIFGIVLVELHLS